MQAKCTKPINVTKKDKTELAWVMGTHLEEMKTSTKLPTGYQTIVKRGRRGQEIIYGQHISNTVGYQWTKYDKA